jgi:hypothetical protein
MLKPLLKPLQTTYVVPIDLKPQTDNEAVVHVKVIVDNDRLIASLTPVIKPSDLKLTLHPTAIGPVKIVPQIQYPTEGFEKFSSADAKSRGLTVNLLPNVQLSTLPDGLWNPKTGFKVSVTELDAPSKTQAGSEVASGTDHPDINRVSRPLDRIGDDLEVLGGDFQAAKSDPQSNLVALQQNQNSIHTIATNHGRTTILGVTASSVHSLVLQWVGEDNSPKACALTIRFKEIRSEELTFSVTNQKCSPNTLFVATDKLSKDISIGPGKPESFGPWLLSVDEIRRRWIFQRGATLRFTWQPSSSKDAPVTEAKK